MTKKDYIELNELEIDDLVKFRYIYPNAAKILCIGSHGIGDSILSLKCAYLASQIIGKENVDVLSCTRDEVFQPLLKLFGNNFHLTQHKDKEKWGKDNWILNNQDELKKLRYYHYTYGGKSDVSYDEFYYIIPDLLYRNPLAFNYKKYHNHPQTIKSTRILTHKWNSDNKTVYLSLASTTEGYLYNNIGSLLRNLGKALPDYNFFFPVVQKWADKQNIDYGDLSNLPSNVEIKENPDFLECIEVMYRSCFAITSCNGPSHVLYELGIPRLLLDPQYLKPMWVTRWRENNDESININTSVSDIVNLTKTLLETPQTTLLSRQMVLNMIYRNADFSKELFFKY